MSPNDKCEELVCSKLYYCNQNLSSWFIIFNPNNRMCMHAHPN